MGVDCVITLSPQARLDDVATAVGILLGAEKVRLPLPGGGTYVKVPAVKTRGIPELPQCAYIEVDSKPPLLYHFEFGRGGHRGLLLRSTPLYCALGKRLVQFFGGTFQYTDHNDTALEADAPGWIDAEDGEEWERLQEELFNLAPLTEEDWKEVADFCAYS